MRAIKITVSTIIIVLLFVFLVMPAGLGLWMKHSYDKLIDNLPPSPYVSMKLSKFEWGWFQSKATIILDFHHNGIRPSDNTRYIINTKVRQGPIIFSKTVNGATRVLLALAKTSSDSSGLGAQSTSTWYFNNTIVTHLRAKHFNLSLTGAALKLKNLHGVIAYELNHKKLKGLITIASGSLGMQLSPNTKPAGLFTFSGATYTGAIHRIGLIGYGKQNIRLDSFTFITPNDINNLTINNSNFTSNVTHDKGTTSMRLILSAKKIVNSKFGVNMLTLDFAFNDINTKALTQFLQIARQQKKNKSDKVIMAKLTKPALALVRKGFSLNLNQLNFGTTQGKVEAKGSINIPKLDDKANIMQTAARISSSFNVQVPKQWLLEQVTHFFTMAQNKKPGATITPHDKAVAAIKQWEAQYLIRAEGNHYISEVSFKNGKLLINGITPDFKKKAPSTDTGSPQINTQGDTQEATPTER